MLLTIRSFSFHSAMKKRSSTLAIANALTLRGQMKYMTDWDAIIFLGVPM